MGKVKEWLMTMEEDAADMSKLQFCAKYNSCPKIIFNLNKYKPF